MIKKTLFFITLFIIFPAAAADIQALMNDTDFMEDILKSPVELSSPLETLKTPYPMRGKNLDLLKAQVAARKSRTTQSISRGKDMKTLKDKCYKKKYVCKVCSNLYRSSSALNFHRQSKHGTPWACFHCPKTYPASSSLLLHLKTNHPEERSETPLLCDNGCSHKIYWPSVIAHHKLVCKKDPTLR
jgi:hypothetical protein